MHAVLSAGPKSMTIISPLLKELNWLPLEKSIYLTSATLAFKCMTGSAPDDYLTSKFTKRFNISERETRNSQSVHIPLFKSASGQRGFYYNFCCAKLNIHLLKFISIEKVSVAER